MELLVLYIMSISHQFVQDCAFDIARKALIKHVRTNVFASKCNERLHKFKSNICVLECDPLELLCLKEP